MKKELKKEEEKNPWYIKMAGLAVLVVVPLVLIIGGFGNAGSWKSWLWIIVGSLIALASMYYVYHRTDKDQDINNGEGE